MKEVKKHKGELVLDFLEVVRLEGLDEEPVIVPEDFYYVFYSINKGRYLSSCAGGFTPLKGLIKDKDYKYIKRQFDLNVERGRLRNDA
jgi:hypothetical protein